MLTIPDHLEVFQGGQILAETNGFVRGSGTLTFQWTPDMGAEENSSIVRVVMTGLPGATGTVWSYSLSCPSISQRPSPVKTK